MRQCAAKESHLNERETWIELLRVISMFWIILFHFADHGTIDMVSAPISINWCVLAFARVGGDVGNGIFVLISGYLLYNKTFKLSRVITLWAEVEFYSVISYVLSIALGVEPWQGIADLLKNIFPIIGCNYWFISSYMVMYFLSPFINHFIRSADKKKHFACIVMLLCLFSLPRMLPHIHWMSSEKYIDIFIILYLIGTYIKKYNLFTSENKPGLSVATVAMLIALVSSEIVIKIIMPEKFHFFVSPINRITVIATSVLLFGVFKGMAIPKKRLILCCAQSTFGIYLIHIGRLEKLFFERVFDISTIYHKAYFVIGLLFFSITIFAVCVLIDQLRIHFIEKPLRPMIGRLSNDLEEKIYKMEQTIETRLDQRESIE